LHTPEEKKATGMPVAFEGSTKQNSHGQERPVAENQRNLTANRQQAHSDKAHNHCYLQRLCALH
jgi:hypothetical protein